MAKNQTDKSNLECKFFESASDVVDIFLVLRKEADKVSVFSYSLTKKPKIVLSQVETVHVTVSVSGVISFAFILSFQK